MISIQHSQDSQEQKPQTHRSSDMTTDLTQTLTLQFISETNEPQQVKIEDLQKSLTSEIPSYDIINEYSRLFTISIQPTYLISYQNFKNQKNCNEEQLGVGGNGQVFLCTDLRTLELHAVKVVTDIGFENVSPILYECINQSLLMAFSKEMILNIVNEILIRVVNSKVDFQIPLELAEFSLYEYIQSNEINEEIYYQLTNILIEFLILLHKNNYAHRDIKPQNILYVKDVGWKLADFGESIKYEVSQGMHKINGTLAFIPQDVRKHFKQNREILQDLFRNDVYATVCTIVMIKNPQFKSQELQTFMLDNQLDATCQRLLNISKLEDLYQLKQEKLSKFQYYGKLVNRKDELVFYDVKVIIQLYSKFNKKLDNKIVQIIDTELGKLKDNNKIIEYNKVVLQLIQYFPFQTDKFTNFDAQFDHSIFLRNPYQYFSNAMELCKFYYDRGIHNQIINHSEKIEQNYLVHGSIMRIQKSIQYGYLDDAKAQLNLLANKIYSESSQVNSDFLGYYNQMYYKLHNEFPLMDSEQTQVIEQNQHNKELNEFSQKDLNEQDIQDYLNIKNFKPGGRLNLSALLHPLQKKFIRFRNQQIFEHILHHIGCNIEQIQENRQLLSQLIKQHLQSNHSHLQNLQITIYGCMILYQNYNLLPELLDLLVYFEKILIQLGPGVHNVQQSIEIQRLIIKYNIDIDYKLQTFDKYTPIADDAQNLYDSLHYVIKTYICSFQLKIIKQQFKHKVMNKFKLTCTLELLTSLKLVQYQKTNKEKLIDLQNFLSNCIFQSKPKYQQKFLQGTIIMFQQAKRKELFINHLYDLRQNQRLRNNFNFNQDLLYESINLLKIFSKILLKYYNLYKIQKFFPTLKVILFPTCYINNQKLFQNYKQHLNAFKICPKLKRFLPLHNEDLKQMYLSKS